MLSMIFYFFGLIFSMSYLSMESLIVLIILCLLFLILKGGVFCFSGDMNMMMIGLGGDIFSFSMVLLSLLIVILMLMGEKKVKDNGGKLMYKFLVLMIMILLVMSFLVLDLLLFYLFFELVLVPMILLILLFGYQPERLESGIYMLMYTMFGSLPLLVGIMSISWKGSTSFMYMYMYKNTVLVDWSLISMLAFLIKLPMYLFHIWLPKAHVEAPVSGSMILAGILLKLGCYGIIRLLPYMVMSTFMVSLLMIFGLWGGVLGAFMCLRQLDMKKLVAYSSVVHSGFFLSGVVTSGGLGIYGGLMMMIGHGLCSSSLFYLVNMIYESLNTRSLSIAKGYFTYMPSMMMWMFLLSAANMAAPPFLNLFGEIMLGCGIIVWDSILSFILMVIYFIGVAYGIYFYSVVCHGNWLSKCMTFEVKVIDYLNLLMHFFPIFFLIFSLKMVL